MYKYEKNNWYGKTNHHQWDKVDGKWLRKYPDYNTKGDIIAYIIGAIAFCAIPIIGPIISIVFIVMILNSAGRATRRACSTKYDIKCRKKAYEHYNHGKKF